MNKYSGKAIVYLGVIALIMLPPAVYSQSMDNAYQDKGNVQGNNLRSNRKQARKRFLDSLNLTDEQKDKLKEQNAKYKEQGKELRSKLRAKRKELRDELNKDTIDKKKIDAIVSEISSLSAQQTKQMVDRIISTKGILTPEQFKKFQERVRSVRQKIKQRFGNRNRTGNSFRGGMNQGLEKGAGQ